MKTPFPQEHEPGDLFTDEIGNVWVVDSYMHSPSVRMRRVWPSTPDAPQEIKAGSVYGLCWDGFKKIERTTP